MSELNATPGPLAAAGHRTHPSRGEHCPWWCTNTAADHLTEYDSTEVDDDQILYRIHTRYFGDHDLAITQDEKNSRGVTSMLPVGLRIYGEPKGTAEAKQFARWMQEAAELLDRIETTAELVDAPACAPWCTVEHEGVLKGWETIEEHAGRSVPDSVQKDCRVMLGVARCDDGTVAVELHRRACVDYLGSCWDGIYVGDEMVELHPDREFSRMNVHQLGEFLSILERGEDTLSASRAERDS